MSRFVSACPMRWGDMDALGHVNNTVYLSYLEQARIHLFSGLSTNADGTFDGNVILARQEISYLRPVVYHPEPLRVELWVARIGGASFELQYEVFDPAAGAEPARSLAARASGTCVMYNFATATPRRLTAGERDALAAYRDEPDVAG